MSTYLDSLTMFLALFALVKYSNMIVKGFSVLKLLGLTVASTYLLAQSSWTVAWLMGDTWGRDWANYVWFLFNSLVFILLLKVTGDCNEEK